jgi:hypothetical protein
MPAAAICRYRPVVPVARRWWVGPGAEVGFLGARPRQTVIAADLLPFRFVLDAAE